MYTNFIDELRSTMKTPDQMARERDQQIRELEAAHKIKYANEYDRILSSVPYDILSNIKKGLLDAAKEGKIGLDKNGKYIITYENIIATTRSCLTKPSCVSWGKGELSDDFAVLTIDLDSIIRGHGITRSKAERRYNFKFKRGDIVDSVFEKLKTLASNEHISCTMFNRIEFFGWANKTRKLDCDSSESLIAANWDEMFIEISIVIKAQATP